MKNLPIFCPHQYASTSLESRELIHEVKEEDLFKWVATYLSQCFNLGNELFLLIDILGVPFHIVEEFFGNWQHVEVIHEFFQRFPVIMHYLCPSLFGSIV